MPNAEYHQAEGLSFTGLKNFEISPAHYKWRRDNPQKPRSELFSGAHLAILEPEIFEDEIFVIADRRKKAHREEAAAAEEAGKTILTVPEYDTIQNMRDAVLKHPLANPLVTYGTNEESFFVEHPDLKIMMKCRPDARWDKIVLNGKKLIADVKGFDDLRPINVRRQILKMRYHWQSAWYVDVLKQSTGDDYLFVHIFVESKPPYGVRTFFLNDATLEFAREQYYPLLPDYKESLVTGEWPCYPQNLEDLTLV